MTEPGILVLLGEVSLGLAAYKWADVDKTLEFAFPGLAVHHSCIYLVRFYRVYFSGYAEEGSGFI